MADDIIQIGTDGNGKMVDNSSLTVGTNTVYRQRFNLADPTDPYGLAKVMSTRPVGTENGLVVRTAGNTYIQGAPQPNASGTLSASGQSVGSTTDFSTAGNITVIVTASAAFNLALSFEVSWDATNWIPIQGSRSDSGVLESVTQSFTTAPRSWNFGLQGYNYFRVRCSTYSTGSVSVLCDAGSGWFSPCVASTSQGSSPTGTAFTSPVAPVIIGGGSVAGGTNATAATVKAASTVAATTDTGLVVALHPSSPLPSGSNTIGAINVVNAAATAKSTQGANGVPVQDLKDAGRSARLIMANAVAIAATADTISAALISSTDNAANSGAFQTYTVTTGKRFRIQQIVASLHTISGNTTPAMVIVRIRTGTSGTVSTTNPIQVVFAVPGVTAANNSTAPIDVAIPDGWELPSASVLGMSFECPGYVATTAAPRINVSIIGYEY